MSLVSHAMRELTEIIPDDPDLIQCYLEIVMAYDAKKGSGEDIDLDILIELFQGHHVAPITTDKKDWVLEAESVYRNVRDSRIVSDDGGRTYFVLTETDGTVDDLERHISIRKEA